MAVIQMPGQPGKDGNGMITKWYKKTGDWVAEGDELFTFDTDEGTYTVKSQKAGRLVAIFVPEGEVVHCPADVGMFTTATPSQPMLTLVDAEKETSAEEEAEDEAIEETPAEDESTEDPAENETAQESEAFPEDESPEEEEENSNDSEAEEEMLAENAEDELNFAAALEALEEEQAETLGEEAALEGEASEAFFEEEDDTEESAEPDMQEVPSEEEIEQEEQLPILPACLSICVDVDEALEISEKTGIALGAMVRFAAMHTEYVDLLDSVEEESLRALNQVELPNLCDLSKSGITSILRTGDGSLCLLVPAPKTGWRADGDALEEIQTIDLALNFDENALSLADAAAFLRAVKENMENLLTLLI